MAYFLIHNSDGDTYVREVNQKELIEHAYEGVTFLKEIPNEDTNYWGGGYLIIKGEIVTPRPKEVVTEYVID